MVDVKVEIAFDSGFTTPEADRTWTDLSERIEGEESISITRGRGDERSQVDASTMSVTLDNTDGALTPDNAASPYYPDVKKGRPIRLTVTRDGTDYVRFTGYVDDWPVQWPDGGDEFSTVVVSASSRSARMSQSAELRSIVEETILDLGPSAYYPMNDPAGSTSVSDASGNSRTAVLVGTGAAPTFGDASGVDTDSQTAAVFPSGGQYLQYAGQQALAGQQVTAFAFYRTTTSADFYPILAGGGVIRPGQAVGVLLDCGGGVLLGASTLNTSTGMQSTFQIAGSGRNDGMTHFIAITLDQDTRTQKLYDESGLLSTKTTPAGADPMVTNWLQLGFNGGGTLYHSGIFPRVLSAAELASIADAGFTAGDGDSSGERIERLAAFANIPSGEVDADPGLSTDLAGQHTDGETAVSLMQTVADSEAGVVFDGRDGHVIFHDRGRRYTASSAFTVQASLQQVESGIEPVHDDFGMVNDATATGGTGGVLASRSFDQASIDDYGTYRTTRDLLSNDELELQAATDWLVSRYANPRTRIPSVPVDVLNASATLAAALLNADIDTRFTLAGLPAQAPAASLDLLVEGYSESISATSHTITFNVSAADVYQVLILDDATRGQLDSTTYVIAY